MDFGTWMKEKLVTVATRRVTRIVHCLNMTSLLTYDDVMGCVCVCALFVVGSYFNLNLSQDGTVATKMRRELMWSREQSGIQW